MSDRDWITERRLYRRRRLRRRRLVALVAAGITLVAVSALITVWATSGGSPAAESATPSLQDVAEAPRPTSTTSTPSRSASGGDSSIERRPLSGKVIAIDPGHNGLNYLHSSEINRLVNAGTLWKACDTTGTQTNDGYTEAEYNFDVSQRLARILRRKGARVVLTRTNNRGWGPCITERAAIGNRAGADVAISIHADGGPSSGRGFHVIYPPSIKGLTDDIAKESRRLGITIRAAFRRSGMPEATYVGQRGLNVRSDLGGLNLSDVPKVLFETGNMRNATDAALLKSAAFRQRAASAIAKGLTNFLSMH